MMRVRVSASSFGWSLCAVLGACGTPPSTPADPVVPDPPPLVDPLPAGSRASAITGGTLAASADGRLLAAADPDGDRVFVVTAATGAVRTVALNAGDEPGRVLAGEDSRFYVALRRGGAVVSVDGETGTAVDRRAVCATPRGLALQGSGAGAQLHVACQSGELVTLAAAGGPPQRTLHLSQDGELGDLRDVLVVGGELYVTRFRSAELLRIGADGSILKSQRPTPSVDILAMPNQQITREPAVAYRAVAMPDGRMLMLHQDAQKEPVTPGKGGYGGGGRCFGGIVGTVVTNFAPGLGNEPKSGRVGFAVLPVDLALTRDGSRVALVAAGNSGGKAGPVMVLDPAALDNQGCMPNLQPSQVSNAVAVAYAGSDLWVQTRAPQSLQRLDATGAQVLASIALATGGEDRGHAIFHQSSNAFLACASCHPEGGEDGRVWDFVGIGPRRTQSLRGGISATAPFHWDGDLADMSALMTEVFFTRMGGPLNGAVNAGDADALLGWLDRQPALPRPGVGDAAAVARGKAIFNDAKVGCAGCHSGARFTNNQSVDVGTGKAFQVPQLVGLAAHAPYLHDGRSASLRARLGDGNTRHGNVAELAPGQIDDLAAYLRTL